MNPVLLDFPEQFESERLTLRAPRPGDGALVHPAVLESLKELEPWMPWVHPVPTPEEEEAIIREARARFMLRQELWLLLWLKGTDTFVGGSGMHHIDWDVPKFEIGYWVRTKFAGQGYIKEATAAVTRFAFETLGARRVEIHVDDRNERSWRIPERLGYMLEGKLANYTRDTAGGLCDMRIYSLTRKDS